MLVTMPDRLPVILVVCEKHLRRRGVVSQPGISESQALVSTICAAINQALMNTQKDI